MVHPEQIVLIAAAAKELEERGADAAALLIDAAAVLAVEVGLARDELEARLRKSFETLSQSLQAYGTIGAAAARRQ